MKEKIFKKMREYGWNLYNDWNNVYDTHYNLLQDLYDFLHCLGDYECFGKDETDVDINDIDQQKLTNMVDFMSDFVRAINDIDEENNNEK